MATKTAQLELTSEQRSIKSNLRNAYLAESVTVVRTAAMVRAEEGRWFETAVLLELAVEIALGE